MIVWSSGRYSRRLPLSSTPMWIPPHGPRIVRVGDCRRCTWERIIPRLFFQAIGHADVDGALLLQYLTLTTTNSTVSCRVVSCRVVCCAYLFLRLSFGTLFCWCHKVVGVGGVSAGQSGAPKFKQLITYSYSIIQNNATDFLARQAKRVSKKKKKNTVQCTPTQD